MLCVERRDELNAIVRDESLIVSPAIRSCAPRELAVLTSWIKASHKTLRRVDEGLRTCSDEAEALKLQNNSAWKDYSRITAGMMAQRTVLMREKASANAKITDCVLSGSMQTRR